MLPAWTGALLIIGGLSWLTFALPALAHRLAPFNMAPGAIAELVFTLWLLIFGVRTPAIADRSADSGDRITGSR
jgi:hypothetical protein